MPVEFKNTTSAPITKSEPTGLGGSQGRSEAYVRILYQTNNRRQTHE